MIRKAKRFVVYSFFVVGLVFLVFYGLSMAKGVLAPIFLAVILAMLLAPVSNFLEKKGLKRVWAVLLSDLIFVLFILGISWAVGAEIQRILGSWSSIEGRLASLFNQLDSFVQQNSGLSLENLLNIEGVQQGNPQHNQEQKAGEAGEGISFGRLPLKDWLITAMKTILSSLGTLFLLVIYIFFMLLYRRKFYKAVLKFIPEVKQDKGKQILSDIVEDAKQYLFGHVILITFLTILYSAGFYLSGMKSPFTTALLASFLTLVPYVGVLVGDVLALGIAFITTGSQNALWIVLATVSVGQFVESYFMEPYLVGKRVNVNPLFTILSVTIGAAVWGVIGMIVFLPLFSFIKAIADHVPLLYPVGYTIGEEDTSEDE